jgi:enoyl-CoA hydratase/carnithine racemase
MIVAEINYETIKYELAGSVLTITLNRPERLNAYIHQMRIELLDAMDRADEDDAVRAIIFTGAGKAFCAGADLESGNSLSLEKVEKKKSTGDGIPWQTLRDSGGVISLRLFESKKPLIAAINGVAVGWGATLTLPMDVRLCSDTAKMGFVFSRRGVVPEGCSSWFLPRAVGMSTAMEWMLSGRVFPAQEAVSSGLVRSVHPTDELMGEARKIAEEIANNTSSISVALTRQMLWRMTGTDHPMEAHKIETRGMYYSAKSAEAREGIVSFLEKRAPEFPGKVTKDMPPFYPWWQEREFE